MLMLKKFIVVLLCLSLISLGTAYANECSPEVCVDPSGTCTCNPSVNVNTSSIQSAVSMACDGGMVYICSGEYNESVYVNKSLNIFGLGQPSEIVVFNASANDVLLVNSVSYVNISNITVKNGITSGIHLNNVNHSIIRNVNASYNRHGIYLTSSNFNTIINSIISNNLGVESGIHLESSSNNNVIQGNTIENNDVGVFLGSSSHNTIKNNFINNCSCGVDIEVPHSHNTLINNTITNNDKYGIYLDTQDNTTITGNIIYNNLWDFFTQDDPGDNNLLQNLFNNTNASIFYTGDITVNSSSAPVAAPQGWNALGYYINITNSTPAQVNLTMFYDENKVQYEDNIRILEYNGTSWKIPKQYVDKQSNKVIAELTSFSVFGLFERVPPVFHEVRALRWDGKATAHPTNLYYYYNTNNTIRIWVNLSENGLLVQGNFSAIDGNNTLVNATSNGDGTYNLTYTFNASNVLPGEPGRVVIIIAMPSGNYSAYNYTTFIAVLNIQPQNYNPYLGPGTTNWTTIQDFTNASLTFVGYAETNHTTKLGKIEFLEGINLCDLTTVNALQQLGENLRIALATMSLNTAANALAAMDKYSKLTMYNLPFDDPPAIYSNGELVVDPWSYDDKPLNKSINVSFGNSLYFDGYNDYVDVRDSSSLDITENLTIEAWVYKNGTGTGRYASQPSVVSKWGKNNVGYSYQLVFVYNRPEMGLHFQDGTLIWLTNYSVTISNNEWHHIKGTYDGKEARLYVDGKLVASYAKTGKIALSNAHLRIGSEERNGRFFKGYIDNVSIYNGDTLVAFYDFEDVDANSNITRDGSGYGNDGTLNGPVKGIAWGAGILNFTVNHWTTYEAKDIIENETSLTINTSSATGNETNVTVGDDVEITLATTQEVNATLNVTVYTDTPPNTNPLSSTYGLGSNEQALSTFVTFEPSANINETSGNLSWVLIKVYYNASEVASKNIDESKLKLYWWKYGRRTKKKSGES